MRLAVYKIISLFLVAAFVLNYGDVLFWAARNFQKSSQAKSGCACAMPVCCCASAKTAAKQICKDARSNTNVAAQPEKPGLVFIQCGSSERIPILPLHKQILANAPQAVSFYFLDLIDMVLDLKIFKPIEVTRSVFHPPN
jgi:hypothetical protein